MFETQGGNLTTRAYDGLRHDILTGDLASGAPLRISALASERKVSASVIREALTRLSEQGLVTSSPNQGFRVATLSPADLTDLTDLRVELETMALRRAIEQGTLEWEAEIISAHHVLASLDMFEQEHVVNEAWSAAHTRFHRALVADCGSPRLLGVLRTLSDAAEVYRQWAVEPGLAKGRDIAAEHRRLMELTTTRQVDSATAALREHFQQTASILLASQGEELQTSK